MASLILALAAAPALLLGLAGCEDAAATASSEAAAALNDANREYATIMAGPVVAGGESFAERRTKLEGLARKVGGIGAAGGDLATGKAMLEATLHEQLAEMALAEAALLESDLRRQRGLVAVNAREAVRLATLGDARDTVDLRTPRAMLDGRRDQVEAERAEASRLMAELDGPINELGRDNDQDQTEVDRLSAQANTLRREAAEAGLADGFPQFEEAVNREREADAFEIRIAHREIDLDYEYRPEHAFAGQRVEGAQAQLAALNDTRAGLDRYADETAADADAMRGAAAELTGLIRDSVAELDESTTGESSPLVAAYTTAADHASKGARQAGRAAGALRGEDGTAARMSAARLEALHGRIHWNRARGLSGHEDLLATLLDAELADRSVAGRLDEIRGLRAELLTQAGEAYGNAQSQAEQVRFGRNAPNAELAQDALNRFNMSVGAAIAAINNEPPPSETAGMGGRGGDPAMASGGMSGDGPEALIERLTRMTGTRDDIEAFFAMCDVSPATRAMHSVMKRATLMTLPLTEAIAEQFGAGMEIPGASGVPAIRDVRPVSVNEATALYLYDSGMGDAELPLVKRDGRWLIDFERYATGLPGMPEGIDPAMMEAALESQIAMLEPLVTTMARRVRDGEFTTPDEMLAAFMQEMGAAMGRPGN